MKYCKIIPPGLISMDTGTDSNKSSIAYTVVLVSGHESYNFCNTYKKHPEHTETKSHINSAIKVRAFVGFSY